MTVDQPEGRPLNLRDLALEESPDVVSAALKRFRRRTLTRGAWVAALVLGALLVLPLLPAERSLPERYYGSGAIVPVAESASMGPITVTVLDGARLDRETGALHLLATTRTALPVAIVEVYRGASTVPDDQITGADIYQTFFPGRVAEAFVAVRLGTTVITVVVTEGEAERASPVTITIDLRKSQELQRLWR